MLTSETYKQTSAAQPDKPEKDLENRLLSRANRFRRPSWMLRDAALKAAGLLNPAIGGPPMRPYQPKGVWKEIFMGRFNYLPSVGPTQYRRTIYAPDCTRRDQCAVQCHRQAHPPAAHHERRRIERLTRARLPSGGARLHGGVDPARGGAGEAKR